MKTLSFKYTKADGTASDRVLAVMVSPNSMYEGIDISSLEPLEMAMFEQEMDAAYTEYLSKVTLIKDAYDLNHNYRRFDPSKMTNVEIEVV
jgi:hypothetical protein